jgi:hypothetical protein
VIYKSIFLGILFVFKALLPDRADLKNLMFEAMKYKRIEMCRLLIKKGASFRGYHLSEKDVTDNFFLNYLFSIGYNSNTKFLFKFEDELNKKKSIHISILNYFVSNNMYDSVRNLLESKVDVNLSSITKNMKSQAPLELTSNLKIMKLLLEAGAKPVITPFMYPNLKEIYYRKLVLKHGGHSTMPIVYLSKEYIKDLILSLDSRIYEVIVDKIYDFMF